MIKKQFQKKIVTKKKRKEVNILFHFNVTNNDYLLHFLLIHIKTIPRCKIKLMLKHHQVLVNGVSVTHFHYLLSKDDEIVLIKKALPKSNCSFPPNLSLKILYEDKEFIVIDKPCKLLSVSNDREMYNTAYHLVSDYVFRQNKHNRIFVVHRLDAETSGILIFVKNAKLKDALQTHWSTLVKKRSYYAIVDGQMLKKEDTLINFLKKNNLNLVYVSKDIQHSKKAITRYRVIKENKKYSLLDISIDTGRQNQIRVQLGHIGHYVLGDNKYGCPPDPLQRLALHAYLLEFQHPFTNEIMSFKTTMPPKFMILLRKK